MGRAMRRFGAAITNTSHRAYRSDIRRSRLMWLVPLVVALIALLLYASYHDLADAALVMLAMPGAIAGGILFQWICGFDFSITVWIGYIACFGMAAATGSARTTSSRPAPMARTRWARRASVAAVVRPGGWPADRRW